MSTPSKTRRRPKSGEPPGCLEILESSAATNARGWPEGVVAWSAVAFAVVFAFGLRAFRLDVSWDVFIDEIYYLRISQNVLHTLWVYGEEGPFYLHPPGLFFVEAAYIKLLGIRGDLIHQIYGVRYLGAAFAGLSAGVLLWSGRRLAGWPAGIAAAVIFALDPFSIETNSHNMLETPTVLWMLLGYGVLFSALVRGASQPVSWRRAIVAGFLFGLALLTKEVSLLITLLPLGVCFVFGWALPRKLSLLAVVVALTVYAPYPLVVYIRGDWGDFLYQKFAGISRLAGLIHITGFNQRGGPSFLDAIVSRLDEYATTYVLLATGAVAACVLLLADLGAAPAQRLLASWTSGAYAFLTYAVVFGTLEEQYFYYLIVPSILATVVTTALILRKVLANNRTRGMLAPTHGWLALEAAAAVSVVFLILWNACVWQTWVVVHTVPDNGYQRLTAYVEELPPGDRIALTDETQALLMEESGSGGRYEAVGPLLADNVDYVVVNSDLATKGYERPPPEVYRWVRNHGRLVYGFEDRDSDLLGVWRLQDRVKSPAPALDVASNGSVTRR